MSVTRAGLHCEGAALYYPLLIKDQKRHVLIHVNSLVAQDDKNKPLLSQRTAAGTVAPVYEHRRHRPIRTGPEHINRYTDS